MGLARQAILYTLVLHVIVLGALVSVPVSEGVPQSETYAAVDFLDPQDVVEPVQSFEASLQAKLAQQVANLRSNAQSELSSERQSSASDLSQAELEAQVEAELRAMEAEEFERLGAQEKEFDTAGEADVKRQNVGQTFEAWDAQYDGLVTVRYSLEGRSGRDLDVPGYTCEGAAMVEVDIEVSSSGEVVDAVLRQGVAKDCFGQAALRSALLAKFNASSDAPRRQGGTLTYVFVAQ
jgi:hypothetical protein